MHFYPHFRVDADPFWSPEDHAWRECWDYPAKYKSQSPSTYDLVDEVPLPKGGLDEDGRFVSLTAAQNWVEQVIEKCFPSDRYEVHCEFKRQRTSLKDRQRLVQGD
jgi:hypothetical protein